MALLNKREEVTHAQKVVSKIIDVFRMRKESKSFSSRPVAGVEGGGYIYIYIYIYIY